MVQQSSHLKTAEALVPILRDLLKIMSDQSDQVLLLVLCRVVSDRELLEALHTLVSASQDEWDVPFEVADLFL